MPVGKHPLQLYSLATPNGQKVTILLEELLALGHVGAEYDAWLIKISDGDQFSSGFVAVNPNSKIPTLVDRSGTQPIRVFESGAILVYLAEKFGAFLSSEPAARAETLSSAVLADGLGAVPRRRLRPLLRLRADEACIPDQPLRHGGEAPTRRTRPQVGRQRFRGRDEYTIADMAIWPWYGGLVKGWLYGAAEFLSVQDYEHVVRWAEQIFARPAVQRGRKINRITGDPADQIHERHDADDLDTKIEDQLT